jgi:hypothetical protein
MSFVFAVVIFGIFRNKGGKIVDMQDALEFAQSKAKARKDGTTDVTLDDVAGLDSVKHQFEEIVAFLKQPEQFKASGVRPPKGVLLEGPPGAPPRMLFCVRICIAFVEVSEPQLHLPCTAVSNTAILECGHVKVYRTSPGYTYACSDRTCFRNSRM